MTITYRDGSPADLAAIDALFRESFSDTFAHLYKPEDLAAFFDNFTPEAWAEEMTDGRYAFRLAEEGGRIVGFAKFGPPSVPVESNANRAELRQIYILKEWHGQGIAQALMDWAIAEARDRRVHELYLTVYVDNLRAKRVYERYGFEAVGRYDFMVGNHADEDIIMRLTL
jgi:ribosomal protein S18 acetylase RimI-like enzyme